MSEDKAKTDEVFVDGPGQISLSRGVVRMDFVTVEGHPVDNEQDITLKPVQRLIMTTEGMLRTYGSLKRIVDRLIEEGIIKETNPDANADSK